jgi:hypothetical protein
MLLLLFGTFVGAASAAMLFGFAQPLAIESACCEATSKSKAS